jgi:hypothetical protein
MLRAFLPGKAMQSIDLKLSLLAVHGRVGLL